MLSELEKFIEIYCKDIYFQSSEFTSKIINLNFRINTLIYLKKVEGSHRVTLKHEANLEQRSKLKKFQEA